MKVAIITPYYKEEPSILWRCHKSTLDQIHPSRHFLVADGHPSKHVERWDCEHIILSSSHADNGNTPRGIGALSAMKQGYDLICFLDADNWLCSDHVSEAIAIKLQSPETDIAILGRNIVLPDGTLVLNDPEDEFKTHVDTSGFAFFRSAFNLLPIWILMPSCLGPLCDRVMFLAIRQRDMKMTWSPKNTWFFTSNYLNHYSFANRTPLGKTHDIAIKAIAEAYESEKDYFKHLTGIDLTIKLH